MSWGGHRPSRCKRTGKHLLRLRHHRPSSFQVVFHSFVSPFRVGFSLFSKGVDLRVDMTLQIKTGGARVLPFPQRPSKHTVADLRDLRAQLRCIEKAIRILEGLAAKS